MMLHTIGMATGQGRKTIPARVRRAVLDRSDWKCVRCGTHRDVQIDHIKPVALGGTDDVENLQALCAPCNRAKGPLPRLLRQVGGRRIYVAVRLAPSGVDALDRLAADRGTTRSEALRICLGAGMAALGITQAQGRESKAS